MPNRQPDRRARAPKRLRVADAKRLGRDYAIVVGIAAVLTLARFSEAFLVLRAQNVGLPTAMAPWVMVVMSIVYAAHRVPCRFARPIAATARGSCPSVSLRSSLPIWCLRARHDGLTVFAGAALWGLHMGLTQGLMAALVAASAPADLRGTAFGVFNLVCGVALLVASMLAGGLWDAFGPRFTFYAGAALAFAAWIALWRHGGGAAALRKG